MASNTHEEPDEQELEAHHMYMEKIQDVLHPIDDNSGTLPMLRRAIRKGDANREVPVNETFHEQTDDERTKKELKQVEADDQAIQTILLGLPEDIYAAVDNCETA
ncbi:hypothetical protein Tco_0090849 [Tanacetum coccineum]